MKNILKTICAVVLVINLIGCSSVSTTASSPGGTSIEVASIIRGTVVRSDQTPAENAIVEILPVYTTVDKDSEIPRDSIETDSDGWFNKEVNFTGALSVVIQDNSGNGAFKPCTLVTKDTIIDLDTVVLEELANVKIQVSFADELKQNFSLVKADHFFVWSKERGTLFTPDSNGVVLWDSLAAGEYNIRISPQYVGMYRKYEIVDTTILVAPGEFLSLNLNVKNLDYDTIPKKLQDDIDIVNLIRVLNGMNISTGIPPECGIKKGRVSHLVYMHDSIDTLPEELGNLEALEWLFIDNGFYSTSTLSTLPNSIGDLQLLSRLTVKVNSSFVSLPESFGDLNSIEIVEIIGEHGFTELPEEIYSLGMISHCVFPFYWMPSAREEQWAFNVMCKRDTVRFDIWKSAKIFMYGDQVE